jgi:DNA-binding NarL/FixJ family response regulator
MLRCLIVDDSPVFIAAARGLLDREGISVVGEASTGDEALARVAELEPDVILLDINLGRESGFTLARRLESEAGVGPERMIFISTEAEADFADLIAASPVIGFIAKSALSGDAIRNLLATRA